MIIEEYLKGVPERLKQIEKALGLNKTKISEKSGMTRSAYSNIATGAQTPSAEFIYKICSTFDISIDFLIFGKGKIFLKDNEALSNLENHYFDMIKEILKLDKKKRIKMLNHIYSALELVEEEKEEH